MVELTVWYFSTMRTTIDAAGRVVVPKRIREHLQLSGGTEVDIEERDGVVEIRPAGGEIEVVNTPEGPVAVSKQPGRVLTDEVVRQTLERTRG
jgi:AbrB family looped-hinge helix DNA binding protein